MSEKENADNQKRWGEAVMSGHLEAFDDLVAANVIDHDAAPDQGPGPDGFKTFFAGLRTAFPDIAISVEHFFQNGEQAALAYTITGTQNGPFMGFPPTGKRVSARGMQIARYENGKLVERWGSTDELGILKQIGVTIG